MQGRTWKECKNAAAEKTRSYLIKTGGTQVETKSPYEAWRIRISGVTITYYAKGTIYSTPSPFKDPAVVEAWAYIDSLTGSGYTSPSKPFLVGLDETGKGEVIGHIVLTASLFPETIFKKVRALTGTADTKKKQDYDYWVDMFISLNSLKDEGLCFFTEKIPPGDIDRYNINALLDHSYIKLLSTVFKSIEPEQCRIILDDFGAGAKLKGGLQSLKKKGAEVVITHKAEDSFLEVRAASLIAKCIREAEINEINTDSEFEINGLFIGSGNAGNKQTIAWLYKWYKSGKEWPWFIKRSFKTIRSIEGKTGKLIKEPLYREEDTLF